MIAGVRAEPSRLAVGLLLAVLPTFALGFDDPCSRPGSDRPCVTATDCGHACTTLDELLSWAHEPTVSECAWGTLVEFPGAESYSTYAFDLDGELFAYRFDCFLCTDACCDGDVVVPYGGPEVFGELPEDCPPREEPAGCGCSGDPPASGAAAAWLAPMTLVLARRRAVR